MHMYKQTYIHIGQIISRTIRIQSHGYVINREGWLGCGCCACVNVLEPERLAVILLLFL